MSLETPMLRQYKEIKASYMDAILFFRLGDFYEMFLDDAILASRELQLTLTGRGKDASRIPMCGIPHHASENYISKLVSRGYKVAICEQVEDVSVSKGITKREVVKVITPGTLIGHGQLEAKENNFLVAVLPLSDGQFGISYADISTGEFRVGQVASKLDLDAQIERLSPKELLLPFDFLFDFEGLISTYSILDFHHARQALLQHFKVQSLAAFGVELFEQVYPAVWAILEYTRQTQKLALPQLTRLSPIHTDDVLFLDRTTIRNLELTESLYGGPKQATLCGVLDFCQTAMGSRRLKGLLKAPMTDAAILNRRLDAVGVLKEDVLSREEIKYVLNQVYDLERLVSRIATDHHNPRDCIALKQSLVALLDLPGILTQLESSFLGDVATQFLSISEPGHPCQHIIRLLETALVESPPAVITEGKLIRPGYSSELDALVSSFEEIRHWIGTLEAIEREKTGIKSLKVGYNKVFGYYLEVTHTHQHLIPESYIRKQTLTGAERYITPEMKEKESVLLTADERQKALEMQLYHEVIGQIKPHISVLQELASWVGDLDCLHALATAAQKYQYVRPELLPPENLTLFLEESRHPVLERNTQLSFVPNTVSLSRDRNRFILITGPNMAGKSTLMRQVALCVVMAQIGSFVPAKRAHLSIVDKLFTRIGALDNLYSGQSTFMVEMLETATILNNATEQSLVILDEIGRGTATFDGMSIACAVCEYMHEKIGARTLFATHYHELTQLEKRFPEFSNFTMKITEIDQKLVFNHTFIPGPADKSYGIHVGQMAGLPDAVIQSARKHLVGFEAHGGEYLKNERFS